MILAFTSAFRPPHAVRLKFHAALHEQLAVEIRDASTDALHSARTIRDAGDWLKAQGYRYVMGTNGLWEKRG